MSYSLKTGDYVIWRWASGYGHGKIVSIDCEHTEVISRGAHVTRAGTTEDPAVTIIDHNDITVLKFASELEKASD